MINNNSPKTVSESSVLMRYLVMPNHTNPQNSIFGGVVMSWIDMAAAMVAERHSNRPVVTVHVDDISFKAPIKIGDHVLIKASLNYVGKTSMLIGVKVYASGSVKKITLLGLSKSSARLLPPGKTVLFTSRAGIGDMAILTKEGCTNQGFQSMVLNDDTDPYFIFSMGHLLKIHALKHASGSTFLEVSSKQLGKMKILLPMKDEQKKIGAYFRTLDELISKSAAQVQKLKQIKSACLEKMFV